MRKYPHIFIACGYTDMRQGINRLTALVEYRFQLDPLAEGTLFLFCGRRRDRIKVLAHDPDGYILLYKRLFKGHYQWPMCAEDVRELTPGEFAQLLDGFSIESTIDRDAIQRIRRAGCNRTMGKEQVAGR